MVECVRCGISDKNVMLYDVITKEGVIKLCEKCCKYENSPIIRKPTVFQLKEAERKPGVYERLARIAGLDTKEKRAEKTDMLLNQERSLKSLVDKNYQERIQQEAKPRPDLVDNFHWMIMRARRAKHITQKQMAEAIGETEIAIKKAEGGFLPENNYLLNKIQNYLKINLSKDSTKLPDNSLVFSSNKIIENKENFSNKETSENSSFSLNKGNFEKEDLNNLTISDLKKIKEKKDSDKYLQDALEKDKVDLSEEDIHKLIFKR